MTSPATPKAAWWRGLTGYQWFVVTVACGAWFFDTLDQRLFSLARIPALSELMGMEGGNPELQAFAKIATACFLIGWGIGGLVLGSMGDRFGRARMLTISILLYSLCTGLTALSRTPMEFAILRVVTGIGIGGVFGLAVTLIAETVPPAARVATLGLLQILSVVGNLLAAFIKMGTDALASSGAITTQDSWRLLFVIGAVPALLAVGSGFFLKESEPWLALKRAGNLPAAGLGPYRELIGDRDNRRNLVIGTLLAVSGVIGLWAIGEYAVDLQDAIFRPYYREMGVADLNGHVNAAKNYAFIAQMLGAAAGMMIFTWLADRVGRKVAFYIGFGAAFLFTILGYAKMATPFDAYWMMPLMGAAQFGVFAGFSIYLPELFPSRTRSTGVSFAYNLGRFAAAGGSFFSALLTTRVFGGLETPLPLRYSAMVMCAVFLLGMAATAFARETKGQPLPQ